MNEDSTPSFRASRNPPSTAHKTALRICSDNLVGAYRSPRPTEQGQNYWLLGCVRLNRWKKSGRAMNKPALRRCCRRWRLTPTVWRPLCFLRRWRRYAGGLPIRPQHNMRKMKRARKKRPRRARCARVLRIVAPPQLPVDKSGRASTICLSSPFAERYFPTALPGRRWCALRRRGSDHLDDIYHQAFCNRIDLPPGSVPPYR